MKYKFNPIINFYGRCEEALNFYKQCLGGEIPFLSRFKETGMDVPEEHKKKIVHSEFRADGVFFMASDGMPGGEKATTEMIALSINFENTDEQERLFNAMSAGGKVSMALQDTFWGARYGSFTDKFGVRWEFNCQTEQAANS